MEEQMLQLILDVARLIWDLCGLLFSLWALVIVVGCCYSNTNPLTVLIKVWNGEFR